MNRRFAVAVLSVAVAASLVAVALPGDAPAEEPAATLKGTARRLLASHGDAVVHVKAAVKMGGGMGEDTQMEVLGTMIDPSGLTVVSEGGINPMSMMSAMFGEELGEDSPFGQVEIADVKIVLRDGKELPARLVLRDKDLDLAFIAPEEKGLKLPFISMTKGRALDVLDDVVVLNRLGRNLDRTSSVTTTEVSAVVKKPRTFYSVATATAMTGAGLPAFDSSGSAVGIFVMRRGPSGGGGGFGAMLSGMASAMIPIILPCEDVMEVQKQAVEAAAKLIVTPSEDGSAPEGGEGGK